jgi:hypothetical protein
MRNMQQEFVTWETYKHLLEDIEKPRKSMLDRRTFRMHTDQQLAARSAFKA